MGVIASLARSVVVSCALGRCKLLINLVIMPSHVVKLLSQAAVPEDKFPRISLIVGVLVVAAVARGLFLYFNLSLDIAPGWPWGARWGLAAALSDFGTIADYDYASAQIPRFGGEGVVAGWLYSDRGIAYPHLLIKLITGTSSWAALQVFHLAVDTLMVIPIISMAAQLGGRRVAVFSGTIYALYLPQIWLAANPSYPTWLTFGFILSTWAFLRFTEHKVVGLPSFAWLICITLTVAIANEFRSVIFLYGLAMPLWLGLVTGLTKVWGKRSPGFGRQFVSLALVGLSTVILAGAANYTIRGDWTPVRSTLGHNFWVGVGQFDNPYGLIADDGVVTDFYVRERGVPRPISVFDTEYNDWLTDRAIQFVREYPGLYASMAARRSTRILFPAPIVRLVATHIPYTMQPEVRKKAEIRQQLVAQNGVFSVATIEGVIKSDPGYAVSMLVRFIIMLAVPIGVVLALLLGANRRLIALACLPWAYCLVTISPFFGPQRIDVSFTAAMIPVVATGLTLGASWTRRLFHRATPNDRQGA